ncbi:hypothetical protein BJX63DRAFT_439718 [Aspergillus granulosus]|uniref:FAD-binding domain-containing protein n=1 Tax=Aspergillus granulosus TaxID=176169 RepID=A0ABR4GYF3_9EURO
MSGLRVLIIGGGVTGVTLAAVFERYGIDYTLLEKHTNVRPAIGASIGLLAHGSCVLDQLGCFEELLPFGNGIENMDIYGPDGEKIGSHEKVGTYMESMLGYRVFFVERHRLLNALWGAIKDKSKIHLSCRVSKIKHIPGGAAIETSDGRVFTGDFVVGADGVHGKSRDEMWRLAEADGHNLSADRKAMRTSHSCIFGISHGLTQVRSTDAWRNCRQDRHYLICGAPNGLTFWFCFFKSRKRATGHATLRYTDEEKEQYAAEFSTDQTRVDVTFANLYRTSASTGLVPIEEFLGDSVHKMHPITGHGGNAAIENCAYLANRLQDLSRCGQTLAYSQLQDIFSDLQAERQPRTAILTKGAHGLARLESFSTPLLKLVMLHIIPRVPCEKVLAGLAESMTQGQPLKYLPLPQRSKRLVPYDGEVTVVPKLCSTTSSYIWILLFLLAGTLRYLILLTLKSRGRFANLGTDHSSLAWQRFEARTHFCITAIWTIESYRSAFNPGPLMSPIPWLILSQYIGWDTALAIYSSLWVLGTRFQGFYHPWPRAIPRGTADALLVALPVALGGTFMASAPLALPLLSSLLSYMFKRNFDINSTSRFFLLIFIDAGISHISFVKDNLIPALCTASAGPLTDEVVRFAALILLIMLWLFFTTWDLGRVNIIDWCLYRAGLYILLGFMFVGPGATLVTAWWMR